MDFEDYRRHDAVGLAELVARREVSATELLDAAVARMAEVDFIYVAVCAREPVEKAYAFGPPAFEFFSLKDLMADPAQVIGFDGALDARSTVLIGWTPRKAVRRVLSRAAAHSQYQSARPSSPSSSSPSAAVSA